MKNTIFICLCFIILENVFSTPIGAPSLACADMSPRHNATASPNPSPYTFNISPISDGVTIQITATNDFFRGFFVQARDSSGSPVGTYRGSYQTVDCAPLTQNAYTHTEPSDKTSVTFDWLPPVPNVPVTFYASTVRVVNEYWVAQQIGTWAP